ncbi:acyltransferase [Mesorhizobium sp. M7A.F.Ca.CA.001.09.2.1]|uniref:Acyltransferase n=4 Tax=Mesorhizobium TaxID=68287 RepID=A0AB38T668_9HYPH|nr:MULTISPECIES: acyltransferase [Mesorhizobium]RUY40236.1 acyltransferase [Mesorhizobium sp. M7A.F.Ca.CA.001.13.2.1]MDF3216213.1 acyltransferase [Mesorhizobium ciceri]RUY62825.1 acyltransferase [Mesorhizobium sp. M7A.F.Ca.CA.001.13.1.1]RUY73628.1 acyltransferase [Mesorhizobium sp. M7A.F.Ca.CA.001.05.1.1]RUY79347.1 acyltransferase [Mesorhizobium sp. M7A.F.Ca.CA.001.09.2.1]
MNTRPAEQNYIATLDLLRLVAAMAVVFFHYFFRGAAAEGILAEGYPLAAPFALYGYLGVNLFFLISGFVIAWSAENRSWDQFAVARFVRLYPGFLLCMTITFAIVFLAGSPLLSASFVQYAANLSMFAPTFGQPFMDGVYWSIVLELVFYGWVTLALLTGLFQTRKLELILIWLAISALNEFFIGSAAARLLFITEFGPFFAAGVLVHHLHAHGRSLPAMLLLAAAFLISCGTLSVTQHWMLGHYGIAVSSANLVIANVVMHAALIGAVLLRNRLRPSGLTLALGGLTYPLYLLHQDIGYLVINAATPLIGRWFAAFGCGALMLFVSWAIWRACERPAQRLLRIWLGRAVDAGLARFRRVSAGAQPAE